MKVVRYLLLVGIFSLYFIGNAKAEEVKISSLQVKEALAQLVEIKGSGTLERGSGPSPATYTITEPGIGFKKGDKFLVSTNPGSYAIITLNKDGTSSVKLYPGAIITFLDDDGNYAITGVFVQSSFPGSYASVLFDINHATPTNEFLVLTPDVVVGVRGTRFQLNVGYQDGKTEIIGIEKGTTGGTVWNPNDLWVAALDIPSIVLVAGPGGGCIPQYDLAKWVYDTYKSSLSSIFQNIPPAGLPAVCSLSSGMKKVFLTQAYKKFVLTKKNSTPTGVKFDISPNVTDVSAAAANYFAKAQDLHSGVLLKLKHIRAIRKKKRAHWHYHH